MVTATLDSPAGGAPLFDRLVAGTAASDIADRSQLRPLHSHRFEPVPASLPAAELEWPRAAASDRAPGPLPDARQPTATRGRPLASIAPSVRASPASSPDVGAAAPRRGASPETTDSFASPAPPRETHAQHLQDPIAPFMPVARNSSQMPMAPPVSAVPPRPRTSDVRRPASPLAPSLAPAISFLLASHGSSDKRVRSLDKASSLDQRHMPAPAVDRMPPVRPAEARDSVHPQASGRNTGEALRSRDASPLPPLQRPSSQRAESVVEIHIGRIEVRAQAAASPPAAAAPRTAPPTPNALAAHLGARGRGARS
jgi:hypothetical protein